MKVTKRKVEWLNAASPIITGEEVVEVEDQILSDEDSREVQQRGYEILGDKPLGEGCTRQAYLGRFRRGMLKD